MLKIISSPTVTSPLSRFMRVNSLIHTGADCMEQKEGRIEIKGVRGS
jgi:hypothetical protein